MANYAARLERLEQTMGGAACLEPIRVWIQFVDPDPAVGVVSVMAIAQGMEQRSFARKAGESVDQLRARAKAAVGWE